MLKWIPSLFFSTNLTANSSKNLPSQENIAHAIASIQEMSYINVDKSGKNPKFLFYFTLLIKSSLFSEVKKGKILKVQFKPKDTELKKHLIVGKDVKIYYNKSVDLQNRFHLLDLTKAN